MLCAIHCFYHLKRERCSAQLWPFGEPYTSSGVCRGFESLHSRGQRFPPSLQQHTLLVFIGHPKGAPKLLPSPLRCRGVLTQPHLPPNAGMEVYPSRTQLPELLPQPVLAGVIGGICFLSVAIIFSTTAACIMNRRRAARIQKRRQGKEPYGMWGRRVGRGGGSLGCVCTAVISSLCVIVIPPRCVLMAFQIHRLSSPPARSSQLRSKSCPTSRCALPPSSLGLGQGIGLGVPPVGALLFPSVGFWLKKADSAQHPLGSPLRAP